MQCAFRRDARERDSVVSKVALLLGAAVALACVGCGSDPHGTEAAGEDEDAVAPAPDAQNLRRAIERIRRLAESGQGREILESHTYWPPQERTHRDILLETVGSAFSPARVSQLGAAMTIFLAREPEWLSTTIARFDLSDVDERDVPRDAHFVWWDGDWRLLDSASDLAAYRTEQSESLGSSAGTTTAVRH